MACAGETWKLQERPDARVRARDRWSASGVPDIIAGRWGTSWRFVSIEQAKCKTGMLQGVGWVLRSNRCLGPGENIIVSDTSVLSFIVVQCK